MERVYIYGARLDYLIVYLPNMYLKKPNWIIQGCPPDPKYCEM